MPSFSLPMDEPGYDGAKEKVKGGKKEKKEREKGKGEW